MPSIRKSFRSSDAIDGASADPEVGVIVITGEGPKAFVAGADIAEMESFSPSQACRFARFGQGVMAKIEACHKPVIAAVNGYALGGGCELALACDVRIASENARFGQPEVGLGIVPGFGGTQRLVRLVGKATAMDCFDGAGNRCRRALRIGLVNKVVPEGESLEAAKQLAREMLAKSSYAVRQAKKAILGSLSLSSEDGFRLEERVFGECFAHPDQREGMRAFLEKRKPRY